MARRQIDAAIRADLQTQAHDAIAAQPKELYRRSGMLLMTPDSDELPFSEIKKLRSTRGIGTL